MSKRLIALLALINEDNEVLISLRENRKEYNGFWEYPGGKVEKNDKGEPEICANLCLWCLHTVKWLYKRWTTDAALQDVVGRHRIIEGFKGGAQRISRKFLAQKVELTVKVEEGDRWHDRPAPGEEGG